MPGWLQKDGGSTTSVLVRCTCALVDMPRWEQDEATANKDLRFLGDVTQKMTLTKCWKPRTHQLLLCVGTPRHGQGAKQRVKENNAVRQVKQRWS